MTTLWHAAPVWLRLFTVWALPAAIAPHMTTSLNGATIATFAAFMWATHYTLQETQ